MRNADCVSHGALYFANPQSAIRNPQSNMPEWRQEIRQQLASLKLAPAHEAEIVEELTQHLDDHYEELLAGGAAPEEAYRAALAELRDVELLARELHHIERRVEQEPIAMGENRRSNMIASFWQDLRYGIRMLRNNLGFTAVVVLTLALGIGANTAIFSVVDAVLLKTLPVKEPEQLVLFHWQAGEAFRTSGIRGYGRPGTHGISSFHYRIFEKLRDEKLPEQNSPLSDLFAFAPINQLSASVDGQTEMVEGQVVSGGYFPGLGVRPMLGRMIAPEDDDVTAPPVAVLSHRYWQERFGADSSVIGREIKLNKVPFTVIGVTEPAFNGTLQVAQRPAITVPIAFEPELESDNPSMARPGWPGRWWLVLMGRLRPGATIEQARASLDGAFQSLALELMPPPTRESEPAQLEMKDYPRLTALSGSRGMLEGREWFSPKIYLLWGVAGLVLLIACANVANLLLARGALRAPEITVRLAVGAGRWRLIRQLLTESALLGSLGGVAGMLFAIWGVRVLAAISDRRGSLLPANVDYSLNWRALGFTVVLSLMTGIIFGLAPAWRATKLDLASALKEGIRGSSSLSRSRLSKGLVIAQVAIVSLLLVGAGLFIRTLLNLQQVEVGFNQENLLLFRLNPRLNGYSGERQAQLYQQILARLDAIPGVRSATFASAPLIAGYIDTSSVILPGETAQSGADHQILRSAVRENYFTTMEIPLLRGRGFSRQDDERAPRAAVISETMARRFFAGEDPIGKRVGLIAGTAEIIGVARDIKYTSQREEDAPLIYLPWLQWAERFGEMQFALRASGDPATLVTAARQAVREADDTLPIIDVKTQAAQASETLAQERLLAKLLSFFGALALLLAAIGLYGVMAYAVAQRTSEIGIRMALGAQAGDVLRLVIWQGLKLVLIGSVAGALGAFALKQVIESQLYGVRATDPLTYAVVGGLLVAVALMACWIPARRATKVDPVVALRCE
jgi:predicted permease